MKKRTNSARDQLIISPSVPQYVWSSCCWMRQHALNCHLFPFLILQWHFWFFSAHFYLFFAPSSYLAVWLFKIPVLSQFLSLSHTITLSILFNFPFSIFVQYTILSVSLPSVLPVTPLLPSCQCPGTWGRKGHRPGLKTSWACRMTGTDRRTKKERACWTCPCTALASHINTNSDPPLRQQWEKEPIQIQTKAAM